MMARSRLPRKATGTALGPGLAHDRRTWPPEKKLVRDRMLTPLLYGVIIRLHVRYYTAALRKDVRFTSERHLRYYIARREQ